MYNASILDSANIWIYSYAHHLFVYPMFITRNLLIFLFNSFTSYVNRASDPSFTNGRYTPYFSQESDAPSTIAPSFEFKKVLSFSFYSSLTNVSNRIIKTLYCYHKRFILQKRFHTETLTPFFIFQNFSPLSISWVLTVNPAYIKISLMWLHNLYQN